MYYLGYDIGGSSLKGVLVKNREVIRSEVHKLPGSFKALLSLAKKTKNSLYKDKPLGELKGIGFSFAGAMDRERKKMLVSTNIPFLNNQPLEKEIEKVFSPKPIMIAHDIDCFLTAEKTVGMAKELENAFYLAIGTGIGGALMINRKIIEGEHGSLGEVGGMIIDCENKVRFENVAANKYIKEQLNGQSFNEAYNFALEGDKNAKKVFGIIGKNLGIGISNIINILDPGTVILSGGITVAKDLISANLGKGIKRYVISPKAKKTKILYSNLGRFGGALGAALLFENK